MPLNFELMAVNPNDVTGGGGSLAGPAHDADATGPWFVWPNQEYESGASPYAVVAASEVAAMVRGLIAFSRGELEPLAGGEPETDTSHLADQDAGAGSGPASPEFDLDLPDGAEAFLAAFAHRE